MGKKSIRENKNIFQLYREEAGMTRAEASEAMDYISESRIEKYESGKSEVHPDEVMAMSVAYRKPDLCNFYCSKMCPIGKETVAPVVTKDLAQIVLKTLATLNELEEQKDRFIEITADAQVSDDELGDFLKIQRGIEEIGRAADSLNLWVKQMVATGAIDEERLKSAEKEK